MKIEDKLALDLFHVDARSHIAIDKEKCARCAHKLCTRICPVANYQVNPDGSIAFSWQGCLECGTCRIVCDRDAVSWSYPAGGFGISYRY